MTTEERNQILRWMAATADANQKNMTRPQAISGIAKELNVSQTVATDMLNDLIANDLVFEQSKTEIVDIQHGPTMTLTTVYPFVAVTDLGKSTANIW